MKIVDQSIIRKVIETEKCDFVFSQEKDSWTFEVVWDENEKSTLMEGTGSTSPLSALFSLLPTLVSESPKIKKTRKPRTPKLTQVGNTID